MVDRVEIYVKAGDGGLGCNSYKGIKFTRSRHPDGGGGGDGADIIVRVDRKIQTLKRFRFKRIFKAEKGKGGQANKRKGANGRPCVINAPLGTIVSDLKNNLILRDLLGTDEELVVVKGGRGGKGNTRTKSATAGSPGEQRHLCLELKLVADVGIIGYPNAGKSSLLARISCARPKIASYPFTTVSPFLGVIDFEEQAGLTLVEIPGLIEGSHQGKGLGAQFLRHAERARILIHLIDMAAQEGRDPFSDYSNLNQELKNHKPQLASKTQILAPNKMDLPEAKHNLSAFLAKVKKKVYPISALNGQGIEQLLGCLRDHFRENVTNEGKISD